MTKYYIDKQYQDSVYKDTYYSYEVGPYDGLYFDTYEEAFKYAESISYRLADNEIFYIAETE